MPPGAWVELDFAVFAEGFPDRCAAAADDPRPRHVRDADAGWHDPLPMLYSFLAFAHSRALSIAEHAEAVRRDGRRHLLGRRSDQRDVGRRSPLASSKQQVAERSKAIDEHVERIGSRPATKLSSNPSDPARGRRGAVERGRVRDPRPAVARVLARWGTSSREVGSA